MCVCVKSLLQFVPHRSPLDVRQSNTLVQRIMFLGILTNLYDSGRAEALQRRRDVLSAHNAELREEIAKLESELSSLDSQMKQPLADTARSSSGEFAWFFANSIVYDFVSSISVSSLLVLAACVCLWEYQRSQLLVNTGQYLWLQMVLPFYSWCHHGCAHATHISHFDSLIDVTSDDPRS